MGREYTEEKGRGECGILGRLSQKSCIYRYGEGNQTGAMYFLKCEKFDIVTRVISTTFSQSLRHGEGALI